MEEILGSQSVRAIRAFQIDRDQLLLRSVNKEIWLPGEIKRSTCIHARHHGSLKPEADCTCGIWSCKSRKDLSKSFWHLTWAMTRHKGGTRFFGYLSAQIEQWGRVIEHQHGYRSEFARIIPETIQVFPRTEKPIHVKLIRHLREKYAVQDPNVEST